MFYVYLMCGFAQRERLLIISLSAAFPDILFSNISNLLY